MFIPNTPSALSMSGIPETTADHDIYVDPNSGSDITGHGTSSKPFATLTRAFRDIPRHIKHLTRVLCKAGTYNEFPKTLYHEYSENGTLVLECIDDPTVEAGPFTITAWNELGAWWQEHTCQVAGAGWTPDQFAGDFIKVTSGVYTGYYCSIYKNTADTLYLVGNLVYPVAGNTFEIVSPSGVVNVDEGISWGSVPRENILPDPAPLGYDLSRVGIANMSFNTASDETLYGSFQLWGKGSRSSNMILNLTRFEAPNHESFVLSMDDATVDNTAPYLGSIFNNPVHDDINTSCWVVKPQVLDALQDLVNMWGSSVAASICARGKCEAGQGSTGVRFVYSGIGQFRPYRASRTVLDSIFIDTITTAYDGIRQYESELSMQNVYVHAAGDAWRCADNSKAVVGSNFECRVAGVSGYALLMELLAHIVVQNGVPALPTGTTGQINRTFGGAIAWPGAAASINDANGGWVTRG